MTSAVSLILQKSQTDADSTAASRDRTGLERELATVSPGPGASYAA